MNSPLKDTFYFSGFPYLLDIIPRRSVVNSLNLYSGIIEIFLAQNNRFVIGSTPNYVIYEFWNCLLENPERVSKVASFLKRSPLGTDMPIMYMAQEKWAEYKDPYVRAAMFLILNRHSASGNISRGELSKDNFVNFNPTTFSKLKSFEVKNFFLNYNDGVPFLENNPEEIDVNYNLIMGGKYNYNLFDEGKGEVHERVLVNHEELRDFLNITDKKTILIYETHAALSRFYKNFNVTYVDQEGKKVEQKNSTGAIVANF